MHRVRPRFSYLHISRSVQHIRTKVRLIHSKTMASLTTNDRSERHEATRLLYDRVPTALSVLQTHTDLEQRIDLSDLIWLKRCTDKVIAREQNAYEEGKSVLSRKTVDVQQAHYQAEWLKSAVAPCAKISGLRLYRLASSGKAVVDREMATKRIKAATNILSKFTQSGSLTADCFDDTDRISAIATDVGGSWSSTFQSQDLLRDFQPSLITLIGLEAEYADLKQTIDTCFDKIQRQRDEIHSRNICIGDLSSAQGSQLCSLAEELTKLSEMMRKHWSDSLVPARTEIKSQGS